MNMKSSIRIPAKSVSSPNLEQGPLYDELMINQGWKIPREWQENNKAAFDHFTFAHVSNLQ